MTKEANLIAKHRGALMRRALRILGAKDVVRSWMCQPNVWLGDSPASLLETAEGFEVVDTYLTQIEYGVYV